MRLEHLSPVRRRLYSTLPCSLAVLIHALDRNWSYYLQSRVPVPLKDTDTPLSLYCSY
jgi:hypothetical protein